MSVNMFGTTLLCLDFSKNKTEIPWGRHKWSKFSSKRKGRGVGKDPKDREKKQGLWIQIVHPLEKF